MAADQYRPALGGQFTQQRQYFSRQGAVEVGGRLVGDQHRRIVDQGASEGGALRFATGQPFHWIGDFPAEPETVQPFSRGVRQFAVRPAQRVGRQHHVFQHRQAPNQVELLKHEAERVPPHLGQKPFRQVGQQSAVQLDASAGRSRQTADQRQQRSFSGTAGAFEHGDAAALQR